MSVSEDLVWQVEAACLNACPSPRQMVIGGFLLRASGGPTRRTNSVNPLRNPAPGALYDAGPVIAAAERVYASLDRPTLFRVPDIAPGLSASLERRGYAAQTEACTLLADLSASETVSDPQVTFSEQPSAAWLRTRSQINRADAQADRVYRAMTEAILPPRTFAALTLDGTIAAMAYASLQDRLVVIESVGTLQAQRGRGCARRVVAAAMGWGRLHGAEAACLQVVAENRPARALYAALGFRDLYRYHFRQRETGGR